MSKKSSTAKKSSDAVYVAEPIVVRRRGESHTAIRVNVDDTHTFFISMETLDIHKQDTREFNLDWEPYTVYPVRRAAELYLRTPHRQMSAKAKEALTAIVANPATAYAVDPTPAPSQPQPTKEPEMATKFAAKTPKAGKADEKPAAAAKKTAPAKKAAAPAPAAKKAPAKQAAAPAAAKKPGRAPSDEKLKVIDPTAPRRGETAEYVAEAVKLKTFTRQQLIDAMVALGKDPAKARVKVADMVYFKIVEPA